MGTIGEEENVQQSPLLRSFSSPDDDDGQLELSLKRTGTTWTAVAHIITGVIGAGVLSLAWSVAQLGWVAGPLLMIAFASVTILSARLLSDCYRYPDPQYGPSRVRSYMEAVGVYLGETQKIVCGIFVNESLYGCGIAYVITSAVSLRHFVQFTSILLVLVPLVNLLQKFEKNNMATLHSFDVAKGFSADDEHLVRAGTVWTSVAHIVTAVIGSGVLSLAWGTAQLGWIGGPVSLLCFALVTYVSSFLLSDCYRSPDSVTGKRNRSYIEAVRVNLGKKQTWVCGLLQYLNLYGADVAYVITTATSLRYILNRVLKRVLRVFLPM
ncbi:hypothetical protein FEM48_Zijuj01G0096300 [Ziziphus jujuba var. spinosa]|uniref:Amino acid transporter transmembrane domain-containing protein n=1 Tax=Ziziphus jujuba var. spinosa TaxID=714518 RepID=A0A978W0H7_ZIZJJ|nr:hypothetical protein FEM48_Zijuj01G0096300 [Ziziphus jujuba var. spinosa]